MKIVFVPEARSILNHVLIDFFLFPSATIVRDTNKAPFLFTRMDPLVAARVRKPRRTNSAPGSAFRAARNRTLPEALCATLFGKRETLPQFVVKERSNQHIDALEEADGDAPAAVAAATAVCNLSTDDLQEIDMQDILQQMNESSTTHGKHRSKKAGDDESDAAQSTEGPRKNSESNSSSSTTAESRTPSKERSEGETSSPDVGDAQCDEEDEEFDIDETRYLFNKLKETTGYCSEKVSRFVQDLWEQLGEAETGLMLLGRESMAAPAAPVDRKRRLFGAKEPELHQRVLGVLNKVTDDKSKYREIKNELMRLPLPEADPQSLELVVKCFFAKAVREQRFSSHYADLVEELCRVPPNQIQLGDTTQSLSYRLRVALLRRCQEEFANHRSMAEVARDAAKKSLPPDEIESLKASEKNKLCGNVKFVGELFLRRMVSARIIQLILVQLLCGTSSMDTLLAPLPPSYTPEAYECDQMITLLMTTGETFCKSEIGLQTVGAAMRLVKYFTQHHPVQRTRFVLLDLLDAEARKFGKKVPGAQKTKIPVSVAPLSAPPESPPPAGQFGTKSAMPFTIARRPDGSGSSGSAMPTPQRPGPPPALSADSPLSSNARHSMPSSATKGSAPASPMTESGTPKRPVPNGAVKGMIPAPRSASGASPLTPSSNAVGTPVSSGPRVPPTLELIGPLMSTLVSSSDYSVMAREIVSTFTSAKIAMDTWIQRALSLIKAETERSQIAPLLIAIHREHGLPAQELRRTAVSALNRCIESQLYEGGFRLWKFWAQIVAGDVSGIILDDQLHNEVFQHVLETTIDPETKEIDKAIARSFIVDIISVDNNPKKSQFVSSSRFTDVRSNYSRFRPLNVLTNTALALAKKSAVAVAGAKATPQAVPVTAVLDIIACPAIIKLQDVELATYVGLLKGKPSHDELRQLYGGEKVFSSSFTPAKVLSAIYHSEYAAHARSFLDECLDLLVFVIDGANRHLRELALVLELYHCAKGITSAQRSMNEGQRWISRMKYNAVVTIETHNLAHQLLQHDRDAELAIGPTQAPPPPNRSHHGNQGSHDGGRGGHHSVRAIQHHHHHH